MLCSCKNRPLRDVIFDNWSSAANERRACSLTASSVWPRSPGNCRYLAKVPVAGKPGRGAAGCPLRAAGRAGRKPKLNRRQLEQVERLLCQGARAHGFGTDLWTLPRVAAVIERHTGVRYHPGHVWKILGAMNWSLQRPARQARERNEERCASGLRSGGRR